MFARRKPRYEDDEPLVPHGLVWQATDEPEQATENPSATQAESERPMPADSIEMPRPNSGETQARPDTSTSLGAISPPLAWPSPKSASVIRRNPPPVTGRAEATPRANSPATPVAPGSNLVSKAPIQKTTQAPPAGGRQTWAPENKPSVPPQAIAGVRNFAAKAVVPNASSTISQKFEVIEIQAEDTDGAVAGRRESLARALQSLRSQVRTFWAEAAKVFATAGKQTGSAWQSVRFQERVARGNAVAKRSALGFVAFTRATQNQLKSWRESSAPRLTRAKSSVAAFSSSALKQSRMHSAELAQRVRTGRVRVKLVVSPWTQTLIRRGRLAWAARRQAIQREPRLWTSLGMAALSALLTLVVISGVSHYAPGADASNRTANPQTQADPGTAKQVPAISSSGFATRRRSAAKTVRARSAEAKPSPTKRARKPKLVARRVRHNNGDDDYVAPDTYHYYGDSGSR